MRSGCDKVAALGPLLQVRGRGLGAARTGQGRGLGVAPTRKYAVIIVAGIVIRAAIAAVTPGFPNISFESGNSVAP